MTEIPLPPSEGFAEPERKGGCLGGCNKILCILVIAIVVVGGIVAVILFSSQPTVAWDSRSVATWNNQDIQTSDAVYYRNSFTVASSEVQTSELPFVTFLIDIDSMGTDTGSVTIHVAVYQTTVAVVDAAATWTELETYLVGEGDYVDSVDAYADLETYSETYTWVVWFEYVGKTDTWDVDLQIDLNFAYFE